MGWLRDCKSQTDILNCAEEKKMIIKNLHQGV
jgi:hypothetical protein